MSLESSIIETLKEFNIDGNSDRKNIGIWINHNNEDKKIAAIGIRVRKWIAYHGFSINVSNDLKKYQSINPCGITDKGITSLQKIKKNNYDNINEIIEKNFLDIFL